MRLRWKARRVTLRSQLRRDTNKATAHARWAVAMGPASPRPSDGVTTDQARAAGLSSGTGPWPVVRVSRTSTVRRRHRIALSIRARAASCRSSLRRCFVDLGRREWVTQPRRKHSSSPGGKVLRIGGQAFSCHGWMYSSSRIFAKVTSDGVPSDVAGQECLPHGIQRLAKIMNKAAEAVLLISLIICENLGGICPAGN